MAQTNSATARRLYQDWNKRDFEHLASLMTPSGEIVIVGSGTRFKGPAGAKQFAQMWADAFPDGRVKIDKVIDAGTQIVVEYTGQGTQTGVLRAPGGEIAPTGRSVTIELCDVIQFSGGRIKSLRTYFDSATLLTQLGAMPEARVGALA